jgi:hypothetical protein
MPKKNIQLPTTEHLLQLPRWARVAYAVLWARRLHALVNSPTTELKTRQVQTLERAIRLAATVAVAAPRRASDKTVIDLHAAMNKARQLSKELQHANPLASAAALAASKAAESAEHACCDARRQDAAAAADAARAAYEAAPSKAPLAEIRASWQALLEAASTEGWTHASPVPERFIQP